MQTLAAEVSTTLQDYTSKESFRIDFGNKQTHTHLSILSTIAIQTFQKLKYQRQCSWSGLLMNHSRISCKEYWDHENEEDEALNLPNFIDIIGLDVQLSNQKEEDTVNSQIMRLIINGKLSEDYDLLDLGKKLKEGNERNGISG